MKRFIAILLITIMLFVFAGCESYEQMVYESVTEYASEAGFEVIEMLGNHSDYRIYLIYDVDTKAEYLLTWGNGTHGFCPYYDSNGNVAFYKGG